ncbi:MAG: leucine-rich repeat domain-containing protein, partial [Clostridia bacterium]|nr:leucine-rich repeat domain-containing protein [Clostridia bacterium]
MKKIILLLSVIFVVFSAQSVLAEEMNRGNLSDSILWELSEDGILTVSGSGNIEIERYSTPWYQYYRGHGLHAGGPIPSPLIDRPIKSVIIGEGITSIPEGFFNNCKDITSVNLPESLQKLGSAAFFRCSSLKEIALPDNLREIGSSAFGYCPIEKLRLPALIDSIGGSEFAEMSGLKRIIVPKENQNYVFENGKLYSKDKTALYFCYLKSDSENVIIEDGVSVIGDYVFYYKKMNKLVLPDSIESAGVCAFKGSEVNEGNFPSSVKYLHDSSFAYCSWLTYVDISNVEGMAADVFSQSTNIETVIMPRYIKHIGDGAFSGCSKLESVVINPGTTYIGNYAFRNCTSLKEVTLPEGVQVIGSAAFEGCFCLKDPHLPSSLTEIGSAAFNGCASIVNLKLPTSLAKIGRFAFQFCKNLRTLVIPQNVTSIGEMAFCACDSLSTISFCGPVIDLEYKESNQRIMDARFTLNIYYAPGSGWEKGKEIYPDANWTEGIPDRVLTEDNYTELSSQEQSDLTAYLPACKVTLNGREIENTYRQYPFLQYRNIVYFPMTYFDCRFLGVETFWDDYNYKLTVKKSDECGEYYPYTSNEKNADSYTIEKYYNSLNVNGKDIITANDPYVPIKFRDVIYFPLTWRFAVEEFGWDY